MVAIGPDLIWTPMPDYCRYPALKLSPVCPPE